MKILSSFIHPHVVPNLYAGAVKLQNDTKEWVHVTWALDSNAIKIYFQTDWNIQSWSKTFLKEGCIYLIKNTVRKVILWNIIIIQFFLHFYINIFLNVIYTCDGKDEFSAAITAVFGVTGSFRNYNILFELLTCWFDAQETFILISVENSCAVNILWFFDEQKVQ